MQIYKLQKKAIRIIADAKYNASTSNSFKEYKTLPLEQLIQYNKLCFMHLYSNNLLPEAFEGLWPVNWSIQGFAGLRNEYDLYIPYARSENIKRFPFIEFAKCWNNLQNSQDETTVDFRSTPNRLHFKRKLKDYLIDLIT